MQFWNAISENAILDTSCWRHQMETFSASLAICAGNSTVPVNSPHKGQWRRNLMFSLIRVWINGWINNHEAGDLRRYRAHYDVTVMKNDSYLRSTQHGYHYTPIIMYGIQDVKLLFFSVWPFLFGHQCVNADAVFQMPFFSTNNWLIEYQQNTFSSYFNLWKPIHQAEWRIINSG